MPQVNPTVVQGMGEAAAAGARLVETCVDRAVADLQQAESQATGERRQEFSDAWRALLVHRNDWSKRLPRLLGRAFQAEAVGEARPAEGERSLDDDSTLSLLDDTELSRTIEAARLAQQLGAALERPLAELDALMSTALALDGVQPERNPLRPAVYAQVLRDMMAEAKPDPAWPGLWLRFMAKPLAEELAKTYREQAHFLTLQRVSAASYRLRQGPSSVPGALGPASGHAPLGAASRPAPLGRASGPAPLGPASGPAPMGRGAGHGPMGAPSAPAPIGTASGRAPAAAPAGEAPPDEASGFADLPLTNLEAQRLQQFLLRGEPQAHRPLTPGYYAQARQELRELEASQDDTPAYDARALREQASIPAVDRPPRPVDTDSPLPEQVWGRFSAPRERALVHGRLKTQAREVGQVYGLEVVRRLVNRVADDPRLLGPVREAIVGLEPSLLRLAMVAPRFFSDADHPGRLLVEGVAERSFKYNDEFSVEFQGFFGPVAHGFQRLNDIDPLESAEPFRVVLQALKGVWAAQDALDEEAQRQVLDAVQFVDRRQQEADRIALDFRQRPDFEGVPDAIREFVLGTWALVVAHARLTQPAGGVDPGGHLAVVSDLLWSVKRDLTLHEPARAFELIPRLVMKLRAGLASIGQQPEESAPFFHALEALHRPVLKLLAKKRHGLLAPAEPAKVAPPPAPEREPGQPWIAPREMHDAGFEEKPATEVPHAPGAGRSAQRAPQELDEHEVERIVDRLAPGSYVDLYSRQQWRRARLKWTSERRTLFMFVSHGGQPHSMTRRSMERLLKERMLRPVDSGAVVPRALAQLGQQPAAVPA